MPRRDDYDRDYDEGDYDDRDPNDDRPKPRRDDDHQYGKYDEDEYDDYEDRPKKSSRRRAREKVNLPSIFLMIIGGLGIAMGILDAGVRIAGLNKGPNPFVAPQQANDPAVKAGEKIGNVVGPIVRLIWGGVVLTGAIQMRSLKNRGFVMASCIVAMVCCNECCLLGIPFGIWGLVVINDESVKRYF
jgi:hypothetical protein